MRHRMLSATAALLVSTAATMAPALATDPTGNWYTQDRDSQVRIANCGGALCGIGFTMALFIASLGLDEAALAAAKVGILSGSALAAVAGMLVLRRIPVGSSPPKI